MNSWYILMILTTMIVYGEAQEARVNLGTYAPPTAQEKQVLKDIVPSSHPVHHTGHRPIYYLRSVQPQEHSITLNDGTVWKINPHHAKKIQSWSSNSAIVIQANRSWFSSFEYSLYNISKQEHVEANLVKGPYQKQSVTIQQIQHHSNYIQLSNGSEWFVSPSLLSSTRFPLWQTAHAVVIGENTSWFGPKFILININENNYIPANYMHK